MNALKSVIIILLLSIFITPVQGQFMDKLKKSIGNTLEDHAVRSINKGLSKALTKAEDKMWESMFGVRKSSMDSMIIASQEDPEAYQKMMESLYGGASIPIAEEYSFESRLAYKLTTESGKKSNSMDYVVLINPESTYMATRMGEMEMDGEKSDVAMNITTIMDYGNEAMIMIMEEQKMAQVMSMDIVSSKEVAEITEDFNENVSIEKTGKTKDILGYKCHEYYMTSEDAEGSVWIAEDVDFAAKSLFENMGNSSFAKNSDWLDSKGLMMEMDMMVNEGKKKKKSNMKMTLISMDKEQSSYTMSDYQTMNFGSTALKN
jgi:hypothetical protein